MDQIDIFAAAAEDDAIPDTTWPPHYGPFRHWHIDWSPHYGPHVTWEEFVACWSDVQDVEVYKDRKGFRALVHLLRDSSTGLWLGHWDVRSPTGGTCGPASYSPAAYRTREACIEAWKVRTMELLAKYQKRHEVDEARREESRKQWEADRMARAARMLDEDDDPGTGEEGMAERYAEELEDLDEEGDG